MTHTILVILLVCLALLSPSPAGAAQDATPDPYAQAVALVHRGELEGALAAFGRIVAATPADHDARIWMARLEGWLGFRATAEQRYRGVLAENPAHVDAMVGLASLLLQDDRGREAAVILADAERLAPENPEVLAVIARSHFYAARVSTAARYIERAYSIAPSTEHRDLREQIRRANSHWVESTGVVEHFADGLPRAGSGDVSASVRVHDRVRLRGRAQIQDKFGLRERRAGGGLEWRFRTDTSVVATFLAGPDNVVLPRTDANVEVWHTRGNVEWSGIVRRFEFPTVDVSVFVPGVTVTLRERVVLSGRYALARTAFPATEEITHSAGAGLAVRTGPRLWWHGGYSRGTENFETLSPDQLGQFRADTVAAGARIELPQLSTVAALYERQWRTDDHDMGRFTLTFVQRF